MLSSASAPRVVRGPGGPTPSPRRAGIAAGLTGLQPAQCSPGAGPADGVPPARKAGPQPKAQWAGFFVMASKAEKKKKPTKKETKNKKAR